MKVATLYDLLQADASSTYRLWCDGLKLLREVTDPKARQMMEEGQTELYAKAQELLNTNQLNAVQLSKIKVILSRPCEQWLIINRHPNTSLISSY